MSSTTKAVKKTLDALEKVVMVAAVIALRVIVLTIVWQVIARYVTSQSTAWAPELAQTAFVWAALLAIPLGTRAGRHMLVDIWRGRSDLMQKVMFTLASVAIMLICLTLVVYGIEMFQTSSQRKLSSLGISSGWQMAAVPIGFGLSFIFQLEVLVRRFIAPATVEVDPAEQTL